MNKDIKNLFEYLAIASNYQGDREGFVHQLIDVCIYKTIQFEADKLPPKEKFELMYRLEQKSFFEQQEFFYKHISQKQFNESLKKVTNVVINDYITTVSNALSDDDKKKLAVYLQALN